MGRNDVNLQLPEVPHFDVPPIPGPEDDDKRGVADKTFDVAGGATTGADAELRSHEPFPPPTIGDTPQEPRMPQDDATEGSRPLHQQDLFDAAYDQVAQAANMVAEAAGLQAYDRDVNLAQEQDSDLRTNKKTTTFESDAKPPEASPVLAAEVKETADLKAEQPAPHQEEAPHQAEAPHPNVASGNVEVKHIDSQPVHASTTNKIRGAAANAAAAAGHAVHVASEWLHYQTGTLNAVDLLINQHREAETLLHKALDTEDPVSRFRLVERAEDALLIHMRLEEELFFPTVATECPDEQKFVEQSKDEHREAKETIAKLLEMDPANDDFRSTLQELVEEIKKQVEKEESDLLPTAKKSMSAEALKKLGERMHERHGELAKQEKPREMAFTDTDWLHPVRRGSA